jgi:hypothetical protein
MEEDRARSALRVREFLEVFFSSFFVFPPLRFALHYENIHYTVEPRPPLGLSDSPSTITTEFSSQFLVQAVLFAEESMKNEAAGPG